MLLSIIICTRNRADEIVNCLPEVARQSRQFSDVEVLVVDNGSTDNTKDIIKNYTKDLSYPFQYISEPVAGLSQARNTGRSKAHGKALAFIDDDVILKNNWVKQVRQHFLDGKTDCLGGKVSVELESEPPFPMDETTSWYFCATNYGERERFLAAHENPIGCNMSFTIEVFDAIGGFDVKMKLYGDDTDFFRRVREKNFSVLYDPKAEVSQFIPTSRLTRKEIGLKAYKWGEATGVTWLSSSPSKLMKMAKISEYLLRIPYRRFRLALNSNFNYFFTLWCYRGFFDQIIKGLEKKP